MTKTLSSLLTKLHLLQLLLLLLLLLTPGVALGSRMLTSHTSAVPTAEKSLLMVVVAAAVVLR
jgi:hypothetical protein